MRLSRPDDCLSDLSLDEWASGELDAATQAEVERHVASCGRCRARHEELQRHRATFYAAAPTFERHAQRFVRGSSGRSQLRRAFVIGVVGAIALAAAAVLSVVVPRAPQARLKGGPSIHCFVKRGDHVDAANAATVLHPGDLLRFAYSADRPRYFALLGRDSRSASVYFPEGPRASQIRAGSAVAFDFSVELDEVPGPEEIHAVFCADSFELAPLRTSLAEARLVVPSDCQVDVLRFRKEPAR